MIYRGHNLHPIAGYRTHQNFAMKVRLVFQSEITDWTLVESLKIISKLKSFQTLDQSLPRNSF